MPHVAIKLYPGRTIEQKKALTEKIIAAIVEIIGANDRSISVSFEDIDPEDWDDKVVKPDIADKLDCVTKLPGYESKYLKR